MKKELSYLTPEGFTVFTSQFHRNRGTCCKAACLHCPYGYTYKKCGIQFKTATESDASLIEEILQDNGAPSVDWKSFLPENIMFILIKDITAGFILKNHIVIKQVFLKKHFTDQDLSKELLESYLFI